MKVNLFALCIILSSTSLLFATNGRGQDLEKIHVVLSLDNASLYDALKQIEKQSDFRFTYKKQEIKVYSNLKIKKASRSVKATLDLLLRNTPIIYEQIGNYIVLTEKVQDKPQEAEFLFQIFTVTGKVTDAAGQGLPGVNVVIKSTTMGTVTDGEGNYSINAPDENGTLVFSFIGYVREEVPINGRSMIDISLEEDLRSLEEIVVVGYGTQQKSDLTGSVSSISEEEFKKVPIASIGQGLQARVPGVQVVQNSASPGGEVSIRIRGGNSINSSNEPLYVVDGFPINNNSSAEGAGNAAGIASRPAATSDPLASINPNDIVSIEILKDASATAIYGTRGANGVILITTKRGKAGETQLNYDGYYGMQEISHKLDLLNARQYAELANDWRMLQGDDEPPFPNPAQYGEGTDWQDEVFRTAPMQNHQLSVSGGNENTQFFVSGNYFDQQGIMLGSRFQRGTARANIDMKVSDKLQVGTNLTIGRTAGNIAQSSGSRYNGFRTGGVVMGALFMPPTLPVKHEDGTYSLIGDVPFEAEVYNTSNPVADGLLIEDVQTSNRVLGNFFAEYTFLEGLSLRVSAGTNILDVSRNVYYPSTTFIGSGVGGNALQSSSNNFSWLNENILSYQKAFNDNMHQLDIVAGYTLQKSTNATKKVQALGFINDILGGNDIGSGERPLTPQTGKSNEKLASWLGRVNYILHDKYLFTLTGRADGFSGFGADNKWGFFPSAALAWRLSEERFIENLNLFSNLKLRASYGITGNNPGSYRSLPRLNSNFGYTFNDELSVGFGPANIANPDLQWETTAILDIGMDVGFLDHRLTFTLDYYQKKTEDLLLDVTIPTSSGFSSALRNAGSIENYGVELAMGAVAVDHDFQWTIDGNISFNRNEVVDLAGGDEFRAQRIFYTIPGSLIREGEPIGTFFMLEYDGVIQNQQQLDVAPVPAGKTNQLGDSKFVDQNGDGIIDADDRTIVGNPNPDFIYGLTNNFAYKNFDLSIFLQGVQGADVLWAPAFWLRQVNGKANQLTEVLNRWTPENTNTNIPSADDEHYYETSSRIIEDGSFLRVRNITLGYNIPGNKVLRNARVYISVQNLITITDYPGYDPEVNTAEGNNLNLGVDKFGFPMARTFLLGVNIGF